MRVLVAVLIALLAAVPKSAHAQPSPPILETLSPPPISPADMANYCVYANRVYSIGSGLCLGRAGYVCVPSTGPATGNRAYWTGKDDQVFLRPVCN
jgi:hypothetical protein